MLRNEFLRGIMEKVLTSTVLWQDFDAEKENLDVNILNVAEDEYVTKSVYFTGRKVSDGETRVFAETCGKLGKNPKQAVLLIDDYSKRIDEEELRFWADNGFLAMSVDFAGRREKGGYTIYPESLGYCNADNAGDYFLFGETVRESKIYEYALNCMRAVTYLLKEAKVKSVSVVTVKKGARVGVIVLGTDSRVTNGTVIFNSLYAEYPPYRPNKKSKDGEGSLEERLAYEDRSQSWTTGLAPQTYAMQIKVPVYFILSANSPYVDLVSANKMFYRLNDSCRILMLPMVLDYIPDEYAQGIVKWCKNAIVSEDISLRKYSDASGDNYVKLNTKLPVSKLKLWYSRNVNGRARNWVSAPLKKTEDGYLAELDVYCEESSVLAFAFASGSVNYTTPLCEIKISNPRKVKITTRSIYVGTCESNLVPLVRKDVWHGKNNTVEFIASYLNIKGAKSTGLATFAINDPSVRRNENFTVSFDICCSVKQDLTVFAMSDFGFENVVYKSVVRLIGDGKWQRITVEEFKFKMDDGRQMSEDAQVQMLAFAADDEFVINNVFLV